MTNKKESNLIESRKMGSKCIFKSVFLVGTLFFLFSAEIALTKVPGIPEKKSSGIEKTQSKINVAALPLVESVEVLPEATNPEIIFKDDFEGSSSLSSRYADYNSDNGNFAVRDTIGLGGSGKSIGVRWVVGQVGAGSIAYMFGRNPVASQSRSSSDFQEIYWRFYVKTSRGWVGNPLKLTRGTIFASSHRAQAMIGHLWGEKKDLFLILDPASGIDANGRLATTRYNDFSNLRWLGIAKGKTPLYAEPYTGVWHAVEVHIKLNTPGNSDGVFEFWIDDKLEASRKNLNWVGNWAQYGINTIMFGNYWNGGAPRIQERFLDNIVISTRKIGLAQSPRNPLIYKTPFVDSNSSLNQIRFEAQVSSTPDTLNLVWSGAMDGSANQLKIDSNNGLFQGTLSGSNSLDYSIYFVRIREKNSAGNYSAWSPWQIFSTLKSGTDNLPGIPTGLKIQSK